MRLTDLEPQFLRYETKREMIPFAEGPPIGVGPPATVWREADRVYMPYVDKIEQAQGIEFLCPKCFEANGGNVGTHAVICWSSSRGVPDSASPKPGRWRLVGTGYGDLTLDCEPGKSRSVLLTSGCAWHGFVTNGEVT